MSVTRTSKLIRRRRVTFRLWTRPGANVSVAGTFNDWKSGQKRLKEQDEGTFVGTFLIPPGRHEYRFLVDGEWQMDPGCLQWVINRSGTLNSVLTVR